MNINFTLISCPASSPPVPTAASWLAWLWWRCCRLANWSADRSGRTSLRLRSFRRGFSLVRRFALRPADRLLYTLKTKKMHCYWLPTNDWPNDWFEYDQAATLIKKSRMEVLRSLQSSTYIKRLPGADLGEPGGRVVHPVEATAVGLRQARLGQPGLVPW